MARKTHQFRQNYAIVPNWGKILPKCLMIEMDREITSLFILHSSDNMEKTFETSISFIFVVSEHKFSEKFLCIISCKIRRDGYKKDVE